MNKKAILSCILTIAMCISIIAGATSALFTSESKNDIAITSGKVNVQAKVELESLYSPTKINLDGTIEIGDNAANDSTFANGGTVTPNGSSVTLNKLTPGDKAILKVTITNTSTVEFMQRLVLKCAEADSELFGQLVVGLADSADGPYTYYKNFATEWEDRDPIAEGETAVVTYKYISVELPTFVNNEWQEKTCTLNLNVNAVQGNTNATDTGVAEKIYVVSDQEELDAAIADIETSDTILFNAADWSTVNVSFTENKEITLIGVNLGNVTVNAPNGKVHIYNNAETVVGENVALHSLYIWGNVDNVVLNSGRVVAEASSVIGTIKVDATADAVVHLVEGATVANIDCNSVANGANVNIQYPINAVNPPVIGGAAVDSVLVATYNKLAATLEEFKTAINEAADGEVVVLTDNIVVTDLTGGTSGKAFSVVNISGKNITIDLNGKTLSYAPEAYANGVTGIPAFFTITDGSNVTVKNGTVNVEAGSNGSYCFNVLGGSTLNIESGVYTGAPSAVQAADCNVNIYGGTFKLADTCSASAASMAKYLLNCIDKNFTNGSGAITVYGGTFVDFNPADAYGEPTQPTSYLPKGWKVDVNENEYTVSRDEKVILISTAEDLLAYNAGFFAGTVAPDMNVVLLADIDLGGNEWIPLGQTIKLIGADKAYNYRADYFDGNGHTISNYYIDTTDDFAPGADSSSGFFGFLDGTDTVIKDLTLSDFTVLAYRRAAGIVGYSSGSITVENCHVKNADIKAVTELMPAGNYDNGDKVGGIIGHMYENNTVNNCTVTNTTITAHRDMGGIAGFGGGTITNNKISNSTLIQSEINGYEANVTTVGEIWGRSTPKAESGNTAENVTISMRRVDILTLEQLIDFANSVNNGNNYAGKNVTLGANIDLAGMEWTAIGTSSAKAFGGVFDGNGYTISNLNIANGAAGHNGLFGYIKGNADVAPALVKNFTINNVSIAGNGHWTAAVVGEAFVGDVENVTVTGDVSINGGAYTGAIVGKGYSNVENCKVLANEGSEINSNSSYLGGIIGWRGEGNYTVDSCTVENVSLTGSSVLGGVAGLVHTGNIVNNCVLNNVHITYANYTNSDKDGVGAIGGWAFSNSKFTNNTFTGTITTQTTLHNNNVVGLGYDSAAQTGIVFSGNKMNVTVERSAGTVDELKTLIEAAATGSNGSMIINLSQDFDVAGNWETFSPKGYNGVNDIVINGNGHKISNLNAPFMVGSFAGSGSITINDLTIENADISASNFNGLGAGAFVAYSDASGSINFNNCHLVDSSVECTDGYAGGMLGYSSSAGVTFTNCSVSGNTTISGQKSAGALAGHTANITVTDSSVVGCTINQTLTGRKSSPGAGALVGRVSGGILTVSGTITVKNNTLTDADCTSANVAYTPESIYCGNYKPETTGVTIVTE